VKRKAPGVLVFSVAVPVVTLNHWARPVMPNPAAWVRVRKSRASLSRRTGGEAAGDVIANGLELADAEVGRAVEGLGCLVDLDHGAGRPDPQVPHELPLL
jgi:hypothetical protein